MQFLHIAESGYATLVNSDGYNTLSDLQTLVDGLVDCLTADQRTLGFRADVWVNDEGLYRNDFGINFVASYLTGRQIVGPAVITTVSRNGTTTGLTRANIDRLIKDGMHIDGGEDGMGYTPQDVAVLQFV